MMVIPRVFLGIRKTRIDLIFLLGFQDFLQNHFLVMILFSNWKKYLKTSGYKTAFSIQCFDGFKGEN